MTGWTALLVAGALEIVWLVFMKSSHGFSRPWPSAGFVAAAAASFWLLAVALAKVDAALAAA
jgi:quaternary ammonium compound-resistance protein SugE